MNIWKTLEINETKDKDAIRNAYRKKLVRVNPEENQKGFMELRQAYEEALKLAEEKEEQTSIKDESFPDTPVGKWLKKVNEVYKDIYKRTNIDIWKALLQDDVCVSLENKTQARDGLLEFLMNHNYLSQEIWMLIDDKFMIQEYKDELYEIFPVNYINHGVIDNINYEEFIKLNMLESRGGTDYDKYLRMCYNLLYAISEMRFDEAEQILDEIKDLNIYHPYEDMLYADYLIRKDDYDGAEKVMKPLLEKYPDEIEFIRVKAGISTYRHNYEEAKELYGAILKKNPRYYNVLINMGNTCYELGEYEEAKDYFVRVLDIHKSEFIYEKYLACVAALEEKYKIKYNDEPYNIEYVIEYAKTKYQQEKPAEAVELLKKITPNEKNIIKYMHIMGAAYMEMGKYELAQGYLEKCISYTEKLNDDVPNSDERLQLLSRAYQNMAKVLEEQKRYDEAYEYLDKALKTGIHILDIMESKAIFLYHEKKYRDSIKAADNIFKYDANSLTGHMVKGDSLKELEYYSEALEEMDKCIRIEPYNVMNYIYKIEVLFLLGQYDDIKEIIRYLRDKGVKELIVDKWDAAIEGKTGDYRKALDMLNKIIAQIENCTDDYEKSILAASYFEVARISLNVEKKSDKAMEYLDKALELKPDYAEALSYKGYILFIEGSYNEAIEVYLKLLENKPLHFSANEILGEIYEKKNELKKAIEYYTRQIEIAPNNYVYMSRGYVYSLLNMFEEARDDYRQNIEIEPERFNTYRHMANTYTYEEQEEKAIPLYEKALNTENGDKDQWCYIDYSLALERMGNIDKAIELLNECSYKFKNDEILLRIARAYCIAGKYELAENIYYKYAANGEKNKYVVIRDICECISHMGREEEALNIINNLFQNLNEEVAAHTDLSSLKMVEICLKHKNGNCDEFEKDIKEAVGYFLKSGVGNPQSLILLRYVNELRKHQLDEIEFKSDIMKEVVSTMKDYYVYIDVDNNVQEYSDIMCDKAVISLEEGDLEKALSYADAALNHKKCHTCDFCKCADGYFIKAIILELMGRKEESFKCYESAAKYDATDIFFEVEYERVCTNNPDGRAEFEI